MNRSRPHSDHVWGYLDWASVPYLWCMLRQVHWHRVRVGLVLSLILIFAGIAIDSLFSASPALDDGLLLAAAAVITLALLLIHGRGRA